MALRWRDSSKIFICIDLVLVMAACAPGSPRPPSQPPSEPPKPTPQPQPAPAPEVTPPSRPAPPTPASPPSPTTPGPVPPPTPHGTDRPSSRITGQGTPSPGESSVADQQGVPLPNLGIPYTHEEMERYRRIRAQIWKSRLGLMFREFATAVSDAESVVRLSSAITERVYSVSGEELLRITAIQVMTEDLYLSGGFNPEVAYRMTLLQGDISHKEFVLTSLPVQNLLKQAPLFLAFGFLAGSKVFMGTVKNFIGALLKTAVDVFKTGRLTWFRLENLTQDLKTVLSPAFFQDYNLAHALHGFTNTFGPYSFTYVYFFRGRFAASEETESGKVFLYGMEHLLALEDL